MTDRPSSGLLVVAVICTIAGWLALRYAMRVSRPARPQPVGDQRPPADQYGVIEPPAVVALLTNGYVVPPAAITATVLDLAARGWVRLGLADTEVVVLLDGRGREGDALRPFEQQVMNHLAASAFNGVTSAATLAATQRRLGRRWRARFEACVVECSRELGLTRRRYAIDVLGPPALGLLAGVVFAWWSMGDGRGGVAVEDSWRSRGVWVATVLALVALAVSLLRTILGRAELPTQLGASRADLWLGYRSRLRARIPERAGVVSTTEQQLALARAVVMGVAEHVMDQLPVTAEDDHLAWSEAGGTAHVVRVRYPFRPGYGTNPVWAAVVGAAVLAASWWARSYFLRVADREAMGWLYDEVPEQGDWIERVARVLAVVVIVPLVASVWVTVAGIVDLVWTRTRVGAVVRVRRPADVVPLGRALRPLAPRDRYAAYLAVDDGRRNTVTAFLANERTAAPQGATARVRATTLLGYVRSSEPIGTSTRARSVP